MQIAKTKECTMLCIQAATDTEQDWHGVLYAHQILAVIEVAVLSPLGAIRQLVQHMQVTPADDGVGLTLLIHHITLTCTCQIHVMLCCVILCCVLALCGIP